jgi:DNA-binding response OmpR family regulator
VDDESQICELYDAILENTEHHVEIRSRGRAAIDALRSQQFDLVVTDISMPDVTGDQVLIAAKEADASLPVIVVTGHPAEITNRRMHELGVDDVLFKPFNVREFVSLVQRYDLLTSGG